MTTNPYSPLTHRIAITTTVVALLPIIVGALTTTLQAGMAFADWPTSDGQNMLLYDFLRDFREGRIDKFVEHGHRLAGMIIGCLGIVLVVTAWRTETARTVRWLTVAVLLGIIVQGLIGGLRVVEDERKLAMLHGQFAAVVVSLLAVTCVASSRRWQERSDLTVDVAAPTRALPLAVAAPVVLMLQYFLGGLLRHLGMALYEHIGLAILAYGVVVASSVVALLESSRTLRRSGLVMLLAVHAQVALGLGAFLTKFGFPPIGYVAVRNAPAQVVIASLHTVVGLVLVASAVVHLVEVVRVARATRTAMEPMSSLDGLSSASAAGGAS